MKVLIFILLILICIFCKRTTYNTSSC